MNFQYRQKVIVDINGKRRGISAMDFLKAASKSFLNVTLSQNGRLVMACGNRAGERQKMKQLRSWLDVAPTLEALILLNLIQFEALSGAAAVAGAIRDIFEERQAIKWTSGIEETLLGCAEEHVRNTPAGRDFELDE